MAERAVRVVDVAREAGVAAGTVSNVLRGRSTVTPENRERVEAAIRRLGFVPNEAARNLRVGRSQTIAVLAHDVQNPYFANLATGVDDAASSEGAYAMICNTNGSIARESDFLVALEQSRPLGIVLAPIDPHSSLMGRAAELARRGIPVAMVGDRSDDDPFCALHTDDVEGGRLAAEHLIERGHSAVTYLSGPLTFSACQSRLEGLRKGSGSELSVSVLEAGGLTIEEGAKAVERMLLRRSRPTAIFCTNDLLALGALRSLMKAGLRVPDDVAVIGYDDIEYAAGAAVPLTSVAQPSYQMGVDAAELILDESRAPAQHQHRTLVYAPTLVVRDST